MNATLVSISSLLNFVIKIKIQTKKNVPDFTGSVYDCTVNITTFFPEYFHSHVDVTDKVFSVLFLGKIAQIIVPQMHWAKIKCSIKFCVAARFSSDPSVEMQSMCNV